MDVDISEILPDPQHPNMRFTHTLEEARVVIFHETTHAVSCVLCTDLVAVGEKIYACGNNVSHFVCYYCMDRTSEVCPLCKDLKNENWLKLRNQTVEDLAMNYADIKNACRHPFCGKEFPLKFLKRHMSVCPYKRAHCPGYVNRLCSSNIYSPTMLEHHVQKDHSLYIMHEEDGGTKYGGFLSAESGMAVVIGDTTKFKVVYPPYFTVPEWSDIDYMVHYPAHIIDCATLKRFIPTLYLRKYVNNGNATKQTKYVVFLSVDVVESIAIQIKATIQLSHNQLKAETLFAQTLNAVPHRLPSFISLKAPNAYGCFNEDIMKKLMACPVDEDASVGSFGYATITFSNHEDIAKEMSNFI